jgi:hypothetical protein
LRQIIEPWWKYNGLFPQGFFDDLSYKQCGDTKMNKIVLIALSIVITAGFSGPLMSSDYYGFTYRRANFSNEFKIETAEGINARGFADVRSIRSGHHVRIKVDGLLPGETYVILNHWFEPIPNREIGPSGAANDPSCTGHFQFLGAPPPGGIQANKHGEIRLRVNVDHLAPHIWVANLQTFFDVTSNGTTAPQSPDPFVIGGPVLPYQDLFLDEPDFPDNGAITICS